MCDDHEEFCELVKEWLQPVGFKVKSAYNGQEGVEKWQQWHPHFILMDMRMPVMDGYMAATTIKALPGGEETVIVALSADAFVQDSETMREIGCDDVLIKPCNVEYIFEVMKKHLGLDYIYEDETKTEEENSSDTKRQQLKHADLEALSTEVRQQLHQAVILGDSQLLAQALTTIRCHDKNMASILRQWADAYEYERILQFLG